MILGPYIFIAKKIDGGGFSVRVTLAQAIRMQRQMETKGYRLTYLIFRVKPRPRN